MRLVLLVFTAVSLIVLGDTAGKALTSGGTPPFFVAWTRFAIAAVLIAPFCRLTLADLAALRDWRVVLRAALIAGGIASILTALRTEPIATVFGAFFIGPVVSFALSVIVLRERPGPARALLTLLGFVGVMLVVRPGFGATPGLGFALLAGCFYGGFLVASRAVATDYRPRLLLFSQLAIGAVLLTPLGVTGRPGDLAAPTLALLLVSALGSAAGNYALVHANRIGEASRIAPLIYLQLISATLAGAIFFGDWPDPLALIGLGVIAASGLASLAIRR